jgi:hypothetical protein
MIAIQCRKHPKYKAIHPPRHTSKHPQGCDGCWVIWRASWGNGALVFIQRP